MRQRDKRRSILRKADAFLYGMGNVLSIFPVRRRLRFRTSIHEVLYSDWENVGKDMSKAIDIYRRDYHNVEVTQQEEETAE